MPYALDSREGQLPTSSSTLYACPANKSAVVSALLVNTAGEDVDAYLTLQGRNFEAYPLTLASGDCSSTLKHTMTAGDILAGYATLGSSVDYKIDILVRSTTP